MRQQCCMALASFASGNGRHSLRKDAVAVDSNTTRSIRTGMQAANLLTAIAAPCCQTSSRGGSCGHVQSLINSCIRHQGNSHRQVSAHKIGGYQHNQKQPGTAGEPSTHLLVMLPRRVLCALQQVVPQDTANDWFRFTSRPHEYWDHRATKQVPV